MKREDLAAKVLALVTEIAPDVDPASVIAGIDFRDQFDFDSMDTLNFAIALHRELGVEVPEAEYSRLASLDKCVAYLADADREACAAPCVAEPVLADYDAARQGFAWEQAGEAARRPCWRRAQHRARGPSTGTRRGQPASGSPSGSWRRALRRST